MAAISLGEFSERIHYDEICEVEKAEAICFYAYKEKGISSLSMTEVVSMMLECGSGTPNRSRLKANLLKRRSVRADTHGKNSFCLTERGKQLLNKAYGALWIDNETIQSDGTLLDEGLFCGKRDHLDRFIQQINHCFENNCFDAAAVLMRRLMEIALILAFEAQGHGTQIKDRNGQYLMFNGLAQKAIGGQYLGLSREKDHLEQIKLLGNYSAHGLSFTARKKDIECLRLPYRILLESLFRLAKLI